MRWALNTVPLNKGLTTMAGRAEKAQLMRFAFHCGQETTSILDLFFFCSGKIKRLKNIFFQIVCLHKVAVDSLHWNLIFYKKFSLRSIVDSSRALHDLLSINSPGRTCKVLLPFYALFKKKKSVGNEAAVTIGQESGVFLTSRGACLPLGFVFGTGFCTSDIKKMDSICLISKF